MRVLTVFSCACIAGLVVGFFAGAAIGNQEAVFSLVGLVLGGLIGGVHTYQLSRDAALLVRLYSLAQSPRVARSFLWYYSHFDNHSSPEDVDYETFISENPRGSEGYFTWTAIASFFETVGVLVRTGRISEGLVQERWPVDWYWRYLEPLVRFDRERGKGCDTAYYADNFEWLAQRTADKRKAGRVSAKWESGRDTVYK